MTTIDENIWKRSIDNPMPDDKVIWLIAGVSILKGFWCPLNKIIIHHPIFFKNDPIYLTKADISHWRYANEDDEELMSKEQLEAIKYYQKINSESLQKII